MTSLLETLTARGMVHDATPDLAQRLAAGPITAYVGFDPTADSLGVGNLVPVMALAWLQRFGGRPIVLIGGGTGLVGDPSGKRTERPMLSPDVVRANSAAIQAQLSHFLDFGSGALVAGRSASAADAAVMSGALVAGRSASAADAAVASGSAVRPATSARMLDNADWLAPLKLLDFLRDTGKHFTVNYMLQKDAVDSRMESGISFTEFAYMLVQAHDFAHLAEAHGCELQMGGSDQWGNITAGIELAARKSGTKLHGLVFPLLTTSSGAKFGKSEAGNVWLDPEKTSPYAFHQFWLQTEDADVERLLKFFTFLGLDEIAAIVSAHASDPGQRTAQRRLADDVTARIHGADVVARVSAAARILFGGDDVRTADAPTLALVTREVPTQDVDQSALAAGLAIADALVLAGLAQSKGDARRGLAGGGFSINGVPATESQVVTMADVLPGSVVLLRKGKRNWAGLRLRDT